MVTLGLLTSCHRLSWWHVYSGGRSMIGWACRRAVDDWLSVSLCSWSHRSSETHLSSSHSWSYQAKDVAEAVALVVFIQCRGNNFLRYSLAYRWVFQQIIYAARNMQSRQSVSCSWEELGRYVSEMIVLSFLTWGVCRSGMAIEHPGWYIYRQWSRCSLSVVVSVCGGQMRHKERFVTDPPAVDSDPGAHTRLLVLCCCGFQYHLEILFINLWSTTVTRLSTMVWPLLIMAWPLT